MKSINKDKQVMISFSFAL